MKKIIALIFLVLHLFLFQSCIENINSDSQNTENQKVKIVCTTGMIADAAKNIVGELAEVEVLMGAGVDPHLYKAKASDLKKLQEADVIFYNGLHLEGKMGEVFEKLSQKKKIVAIAESIPKNKLINNTEFAGAQDPHIWFDVSIWKDAVLEISKNLKEVDLKNAKKFEENEKKHLQELDELNEWVKSKISEVPENQRVLITAHDAFAYFGKAYGVEVKGLQGISTTAEYGVKDIADLANYISENKIKAVFIESSVPKRSIDAVVEACKQKNHQVKIGGTLFSDAMGEVNTPEGTYIGMVKYNINTIANSLK